MKMHEQMKRLYLAAEELMGIVGQSELSRLMHTSPQVINNWEERGISKRGLLDAEKILGCSAVWIQTGEGSMNSPIVTVSTQNVYSKEIEQMIKLMLMTDERGQNKMISVAQDALELYLAHQKTIQSHSSSEQMMAEIEQIRRITKLIGEPPIPNGVGNQPASVPPRSTRLRKHQ